MPLRASNPWFRAELCEREASGTSLAPFGEGSDIAGPAPMDRPPVHGSTAFVHAVLENMDQGILMLCPNNRVLLQNRRARELLGPSPDELRDGEPFDEIAYNITCEYPIDFGHAYELVLQVAENIDKFCKEL